MSALLNIYCDESCHLQSAAITPQNRFMVLGGLVCSDGDKREVFDRIRDIKQENGLNPHMEVKWTKVSPAKYEAYRDLINYFFDCDLLSFRAVAVDKQQLEHHAFNQSHDEFYYKMYYCLLGRLIDPKNRYHIYLDIKDTQGNVKIEKLRECLSRAEHDFNDRLIPRIQEVRSHEIEILQLADILIGAVSYVNRFPDGGESVAKNNLVALMQKRAGSLLRQSTWPGERKCNIFCWQGRGV